MMRLLKVFLIVGCGWLGLVCNEGRADPGIGGRPRVVESQPYNRVVDQALREVRKQVGDARYDITIVDLDEFMLVEGEVDSEGARERIASVIESTTSKRVRNELRIRPEPTDSQIADRVRMALRQEDPQLAERIQVTVRNSVAYLSGDLRNHREVDQMLAVTLMVDGIADIKSDITLGGRPYATQRVGKKRNHY